MRLWESASVSYAAVCESSPPEAHGQDSARSADAAIDKARRDLIEIKQQIDSLLSAGGRTRAASPEPLRFALLEAQTKPVGGISRESDVVRSGVRKIQQALKRKQCGGQQECPSPDTELTPISLPRRKGSGSREQGHGQHHGGQSKNCGPH